MLASITFCAVVFGLNAASAGFLMLVGVLLIASSQSLAVASFSAVVATLAFNFFFFEPKGTLTIEDPENWIALTTFLLTSLLANRLLGRERRQAEEARLARSAMEALYAMGADLLGGGGGLAPVGDAARRYLERIGVESGGVILFGASPQQQEVLAWAGAPLSDEVEDIAAAVGRHRRMTSISSRFGRDLCLPLVVAGRVGGALLVRTRLDVGSALESAANLLSFAIERERFVEERAHVKALNESDELKTSLLQAVAHDLKSPLTVLAVESEALSRRGAGDAGGSVHVRKIRDEVGRLHRRIDNLLSVARFEAGVLRPSAEPTPAADLLRAARESLPTVTAERTIRTTIEEDTPDLLVDPSLALEIVVNLIENAHRASPPGADVDLRAYPSRETEGRVWIDVCDRGAGLPVDRARFLRASQPAETAGGGLGIELARSLAVLSGGCVEWFPRAEGGTVARFEVTAAPAVVVEEG